MWLKKDGFAVWHKILRVQQVLYKKTAFLGCNKNFMPISVGVIRQEKSCPSSLIHPGLFQDIFLHCLLGDSPDSSVAEGFALMCAQQIV